MERLKLKQQDAASALKTLESVLREPFSTIIRDAAIQRFEYTFEAVWKFTKEYLKEKEGIVSGSPKAVFREMLSLGFADENQTAALLEMVDSRNDTVHTYKEEIAQAIFSKLPGYVTLMQNLLDKLADRA